MTLWVLFVTLSILYLFLVTRWVGLSIEVGEEGLTVSASFSRFHFTVYPRSSGDKGKTGNKEKKLVEPEEDKEEDREPEKKGHKERIKGAMEWLRLAGDFSRVVKNGFGFLRRHGRIGKLNLKGKLGTEDPYLTGTFYGLLEGLKGILDQAVPFSKIEVSPEFGEEILDLSGTFEAEIRLIYLFFLIIFLLWSLPKRRIWRLARS
ncbi:MAG: DUF2953 domain-containing protein [Candidatus Bipolaricaulota bacterium]